VGCDACKCLFLAVKAWVHFQDTPFWICGQQSGTGNVFLQILLFFPTTCCSSDPSLQPVRCVVQAWSTSTWASVKTSRLIQHSLGLETRIQSWIEFNVMTGLKMPCCIIFIRNSLAQWFSSAATEIFYAFILKCQILPLRMLKYLDEKVPIQLQSILKFNCFLSMV
jgi:hypothetical protein